MAKVTVDMAGVERKAKAIPSDSGFGLFLATEAMEGMEPYVPYDTGLLRDSAVAEPFLVSYHTPYARRVFFGKDLHFHQDEHLNATVRTARWDVAYQAAHGSELAAAGTRYLKTGGI